MWSNNFCFCLIPSKKELDKRKMSRKEFFSKLRKIIILYLLLQFLIAMLFADKLHSRKDACEKLKWKVKAAHSWVFGINYPYWFSLGQIRAETNCRWITSLDGLGSIGYAQITGKYWDKVLKKKFPNWKKCSAFDYFLAQAFILKQFNKRNKYHKLFITYQCYNGRCSKILKEVSPTGSWEKGYKACLKHKRKICVWRKGKKCLQYRYDCDINYGYSKKVYKYGIKYKEWSPKHWHYW